MVLVVLASEAFGASGTGPSSTGSRTKADRPSGRKQPAASTPSSEVPTSAKEVPEANKKSQNSNPDATRSTQAPDSLSSSKPTAPPVAAADSPAPNAAFKGDFDARTNEKIVAAAPEPPSSPAVESPQPLAPLFVGGKSVVFDENSLRDVAAFFSTLLQGFSSSDLSQLALIWVAFFITAAATRRLV